MVPKAVRTARPPGCGNLPPALVWLPTVHCLFAWGLASRTGLACPGTLQAPCESASAGHGVYGQLSQLLVPACIPAPDTAPEGQGRTTGPLHWPCPSLVLTCLPPQSMPPGLAYQRSLKCHRVKGPAWLAARAPDTLLAPSPSCLGWHQVALAPGQEKVAEWESGRPGKVQPCFGASGGSSWPWVPWR